MTSVNHESIHRVENTVIFTFVDAAAAKEFLEEVLLELDVDDELEGYDEPSKPITDGLERTLSRGKHGQDS